MSEKFGELLEEWDTEIGPEGEFWTLDDNADGWPYPAWVTPPGDKWEISLNQEVALTEYPGLNRNPGGAYDAGYSCGILRALAFHEMLHVCCGHIGDSNAWSPQHGWVDMETAKHLCDKLSGLKPEPGGSWTDAGKLGEAWALCSRYYQLRNKWKNAKYSAKKNLCNALAGPAPPGCNPPGDCPHAAFTEANEDGLPACEDGGEMEEWEPIPECPCCFQLPVSTG